jgi:hypothetical protein
MGRDDLGAGYQRAEEGSEAYGITHNANAKQRQFLIEAGDLD